MQSILVPITNKTDVRFILDLFDKLHIPAVLIDDDTTQKTAKKSLISFAGQITKVDISNNEVAEEITAYRKKRNAEKKD